MKKKTMNNTSATSEEYIESVATPEFLAKIYSETFQMSKDEATIMIMETPIRKETERIEAEIEGGTRKDNSGQPGKGKEVDQQKSVGALFANIESALSDTKMTPKEKALRIANDIASLFLIDFNFAKYLFVSRKMLLDITPPPYDVRIEVHKLLKRFLDDPKTERKVGLDLAADSILEVPWVKTITGTTDELTTKYLSSLLDSYARSRKSYAGWSIEASSRNNGTKVIARQHFKEEQTILWT